MGGQMIQKQREHGVSAMAQWVKNPTAMAQIAAKAQV